MKIRHSTGNKCLIVSCEDKLKAQAEWLLDKMGQFEFTRKCQQDGETVDVGWATFTVKGSMQELVVYEPDYSRNPFQHLREDISESITVLAWQRDLLDKIGIAKAVGSSFRDKIVIARGCIREPHLFMERKVAPEGDSGWFIGPVSQQEESAFEAIFSYQLLSLRPELLQVITLPPGFVVIFRNESIEAILNERNENLLQNSPRNNPQ